VCVCVCVCVWCVGVCGVCVCVACDVCVCVKRHLLEFGEKVPLNCSEAYSQESVGSEIDNS